MTTIYLLLAAISLLLLINIFLTINSGKNDTSPHIAEIKSAIGQLHTNLKYTEKNLKDEFVTNRTESAGTARELRMETGEQLNKFTQTFSAQLASLTQANEVKLEAVRTTFEERLAGFSQNIDANNKESRHELQENLHIFKNELNSALQDYKERLREQFSHFQNYQQTQNLANAEKIGELRSSLERSVTAMQESNEKKLEEMRKTVDEKLNETLEKRLGESFKQCERQAGSSA